MKKILLILTCLLAGCFHKTFNDEAQSVPSYENDVVSITRMTTANIEAVCEQHQQMSLGIPVSCDFQNKTDTIQWLNVRVSVYSERDGKLVKDYNFPDADLRPNLPWHDYIIIGDSGTQKECGYNLSKCTVLIEKVNPWIPDYKP